MTLKKKASRKIEEYKESLKQNWSRDGYNSVLWDQFGCEIVTGNTMYTLFIHEVEIVKVYSLEAAKIISTIILNDRIMCTPET